MNIMLLIPNINRITTTTKTTITSSRTTYLRQRPTTIISKWMLLLTFTILILNVNFQITVASATDEKPVQPSTVPAAISSSSTPHDEIYIDDEGIEGSGGRGEIHDDLEKETDYSGSGYGPDDEDSATDHQTNRKVNQHQTTTSSINRQDNRNNQLNKDNKKSEYDLGRNSGATSTDKNTDNKNNDPNENNNEDSFIGSGDGGIDAEDDDDDDEDDDDTGDSDYDNNHAIDGHTVANHDDLDIHGGTDSDHHSKDIIDQDKKNTDSDTFDVDGDSDSTDSDLYTETEITNQSGEINKDITKPNNEFDLETDHRNPSSTDHNTNEVLIMNAKNEDRTTSFFAQPGILAAVIGGAVVGLLCAILVVMFIVYRMRKKDEGSYALDEPKRSPAVNSYAKNGNNREFYA